MKQERILQIILAPHMSEKASFATEKKNEYVFQVCKDATKSEIKDAVANLFNAKVKDVHVLNVGTKAKRFRQKLGKTKAWKKAYVTLEAGQQIDLAGFGGKS